MESPTLPDSCLCNRNQAIQELIQGQESIKELNDILWKPQKIEASSILDDGVVVRILEVFENTLSIMRSCSSNEPVQHVTSKLPSLCVSDGKKSKKPDGNQSQVSPAKVKRRKTSWTSSTQVTSVLVDDGHAWRKYGQKQILNFKHQRSYYKCTYKYDQGCLATKHVQKIQDNPSKYETTYIRNHTCNNLLRAPPIILDSMNSTDTSILLSFTTKGFIEPTNVCPSFKFVKYEELDEGFPSLSNNNPNYLSPSSNNHLACDPNTHVPRVTFEPTSTMELARLDHGNLVPLRVHSELDHGGMISLDAYSSMTGTYGYEMDHMLIWKE